ncbi:MAG TPA: HAMP domain-containing protein, partial [Blastocatellia bacterium]|nr:HAMP domain-containing protein [Blastocatellia bacterium]
MSNQPLQPGQERSDAGRRRRRRLRIALLAAATILLFSLLFVQAAINTLPWVRPDSASEAVILYALSTINLLAFVVLLMVLVRNIIKLRRDRRQMKYGAKFKTRLVTYFISISLLPVIFLFFATSGLINRSVEKWFSMPTTEMVMNARGIEEDYISGERTGLERTTITLARLLARTPEGQIPSTLAAECENQQLFFAQFYDPGGRLVAEQARRRFDSLPEEFRAEWRRARLDAARGGNFSALTTEDNGKIMSLIAAAPVAGERGGSLVVAQQVSPQLAERVNLINRFEGVYDALKGKQKWLRNNALLTLGLITLLVLFIAFWMAVYVARSIADPVQQLAQATERIKSGDLNYRAGVVGDDELAALALSFNEMTAELAENRRRLELSASELQLSNAALEERRRYIETVMQSLSAGVVSLDENRKVTMINEAARRMLWVE